MEVMELNSIKENSENLPKDYERQFDIIDSST